MQLGSGFPRKVNRATLMCNTTCVPAQIVTAVPEVRQLGLQSGDEFLLLACDGIWDVLTNQEVRRSSCCAQMLDHCRSCIGIRSQQRSAASCTEKCSAGLGATVR